MYTEDLETLQKRAERAYQHASDELIEALTLRNVFLAELVQQATKTNEHLATIANVLNTLAKVQIER